jgi:hypothetical protein
MQSSGADTAAEDVGREIEEFANAVATRVARAAETARSTTAFSTLANSVASNLDETITRFQEKLVGEPLACQRGCSWCCHEIVLVTPLEVLWIYQTVVSTFNSEQLGALLERLAKYEERMKLRYDQPPTFARATCSFLVNSECSIYSNRPYKCRGVNSTDPELCRVWTESPGDGGLVTSLLSQKFAATAATKGVSIGAAHRLGAKMHDLNRCLNMLFMQPDLAEKVADGEAFLPSVQPVSKAKFFPPDETSISPLEIISPAYQAAVNEAWRGDWEAADESFPANSLANLMLKLRPPGMIVSNDQIDQYEARLDEALTELEHREFDPIQMLPAIVEHITYAMPYQGRSVRAPLERQGKIFLDRVVAKIYPHLCAPIEKPRKPGKFRVGYVSGSLELNNLSRWALGWARNHGSDFETYAFNLGGQDIGSRLWERDTNHYFALQGNGQRIAEFIRSLDLDALIVTDIGARKYNYCFFSMRLARVQCTAWGHPVTSGLPNIDYYLSSQLMEPENAQEEYSEKLILLPRSGLCYPRPKTMFKVGARPNPQKEFVPFMAQNIRKWTPRYDPLLKRIADRSGQTLKFVGVTDRFSNELFSMRLQRSGIPHVVMPPMSQHAYAQCLSEASVLFDPPDWSGGNSTIEALTYGVPVVTLPGQYMRSRHSSAFLELANAQELVAKDEEDYFNLIFDTDRQQQAMRESNPDALYEDKEVVKALDRFLLDKLGGPQNSIA